MAEKSEFSFGCQPLLLQTMILLLCACAHVYVCVGVLTSPSRSETHTTLHHAQTHNHLSLSFSLSLSLARACTHTPEDGQQQQRHHVTCPLCLFPAFLALLHWLLMHLPVLCVFVYLCVHGCIGFARVMVCRCAHTHVLSRELCMHRREI